MHRECPVRPVRPVVPSNEKKDGLIIMQEETVYVTGGVDTHSEVHVAAVVNAIGAILGTKSFPVNSKGFRDLCEWMCSFGSLVQVGVEGTGSYGAGLTRFLEQRQVRVVEVNRPNRLVRRRRGKSDTTDAESAARAALNGEATCVPKAGDGNVEAIRVLRVARRSAVKACTQAANQMSALIVTAPEELRVQLVDLNSRQQVQTCAKFRRVTSGDPLHAARTSLRCLAQRRLNLEFEIEELTASIRVLCAATNPALMGALGVGPDVAASLLVAAGDNPERMRTDASFAALCGASPVEASSGKTVRHRLNHGGNREANNALWRIVLVRLSSDPETQAYAARRKQDGKSSKEIMRCLKRYVAREVFRLLTNPPSTPKGSDLRATRKAAKITLEKAAACLDTYPITISKIERNLTNDTKLATRYEAWLTAQKAS
jgi:transposase